MHTSTAVSPARRQSPTRATRVRKAPTVGARLAGYSSTCDTWYFLIYGSGCASNSARLGPFRWFRNHLASQHRGGDVWTVISEVCGHWSMFEAVIDDFGNLVAVPR